MKMCIRKSIDRWRYNIWYIYTLNQIKVHKHTDFNRVFTSTSTSFFFHLNARSFMFISNANSPICRSLIWCPKLHSHLFTNYIHFFNVNKHAIDVRARSRKKWIKRRFGFIYINHKNKQPHFDICIYVYYFAALWCCFHMIIL